jgi:hypothetical protein
MIPVSHQGFNSHGPESPMASHHGVGFGWTRKDRHGTRPLHRIQCGSQSRGLARLGRPLPLTQGPLV